MEFDEAVDGFGSAVAGAVGVEVALSPRKVEFARAVLRRAMADAVVDRHLEVNPVIGTKRPKTVKPKHTTWTGVQLRDFLDSLDEADRWAPPWLLAAATGMRRGELLALRWADVDLDAGMVRIDRSVTQIAQALTYTSPKNHERRDVTLDGRTLAAMRAWRKVQLGERMTWGAAYRDTEGLVFTWEDVRPVLPDYATRAFGDLTAGREIPRLKLHELRHTHATMLLRDGASPRGGQATRP